MPTALEYAMAQQSGAQDPAGKKKKTVSERVYNEVVEQLDKKNLKVKQIAQHAKNAGKELMYAGETLVSTFATSLTKGAVGDANTKIGGVSIPAVTGAALVGWGIYDVVTGDDGQHQIAIGMGMLTSEVADVGRDAGVKLREAYEKKDGKDKDKATTKSDSTTTTPAPAAKVELGGPLRELEVGRSRLDRLEDPEVRERRARRLGRREERRPGSDGVSFRPRRGGTSSMSTNAVQSLRVLNLGADEDDYSDDDSDLDEDYE